MNEILWILAGIPLGYLGCRGYQFILSKLPTKTPPNDDEFIMEAIPVEYVNGKAYTRHSLDGGRQMLKPISDFEAPIFIEADGTQRSFTLSGDENITDTNGKTETFVVADSLDDNGNEFVYDKWSRN